MAAESVKRSPLETLPLAILEMTCGLLPRADLKNLRLVSRALDEPSLSTLLRTVYLRVHLGSFENLEDISRSEKLRKYVRYISYDGRTLDATRTSSHDFAQWKDYLACSGLHIYDKKRTKFLQQFNEMDLWDIYENYKQYLFEQQHMSRRDYEKNMLRDALQNFPRLLGVEFILRSSRERIPSGRIPKLTSLSPVAQKILAEPEARNELTEPERHFWTLLQSVCLAGHAQRLASLRASDMDLRLWNHIAASLGDYHETPSSLQHLSLEFQVTAYSGKETTNLAALIARAASLRSLRLHFVKVDEEGPQVITPLRKVITDAAHLQHLQSLSLKCLATHETYLRSILRSNRETLRSLELSNMRFYSGSWILFIEYLNKEMMLHHVKFDGSLSNSGDEKWAVRDETYGLHRATGLTGDGCYEWLADRIERFVVSGDTCANPFTPRRRRDDEKHVCGFSLPWEFEEDNSWFYQPTW